MGRAPCCDKTKVKRGPWSPDEDATLRNFVQNHGIAGNWISLPQKAGLKRCGKSCRLRWLNYLRPNLKHGGFTEEEDNIILTLYQNIGSRWSVIASNLPGRTDNNVKNYWNTKLKKKFLPTPVGTTVTNNFSVAPPRSSSALPNIVNFSENSNLSNNVTTENTLPFNNPLANYFNPEIPQNLEEAASSFSSSAFSLDDVGGTSSNVMGLGSELMSFDYLLNDFDFQEIIPNFA